VTTDIPPGELVRLADTVAALDDHASRHIVLKNPYTWHPPMTETNGRWLLYPDMDSIAELSRELFGPRSRYSR
jgi:hypothetical protein